MTRLILAESISHDPYFNLSLEKYLFDSVTEDEFILYLWQNQKTVVCGRNQNICRECNLAVLNDLGGKVARRLSGGGAVWHDLGNLNVSFISKDTCADTERDFRIMKNAVESFGINVEQSGRNDLTTSGRKFSGTAFYKANGSVCHHCTLMVDVDTSTIDELLTVSREKLQSKGVDSVHSRVVNLREFSQDITPDSLRAALKSACLRDFGVRLFDSTITVGGKTLVSATGFSGFTAAGSMLTMLQALAEGRDFFGSEKWLFGRNPEFTNTFSHRFYRKSGEGTEEVPFGELEFNLRVTGGVIAECRIYADSLYPDLILSLENALKGKVYTAEEEIIALAEKAIAEGTTNLPSGE